MAGDESGTESRFQTRRALLITYTGPNRVAALLQYRRKVCSPPVLSSCTLRE